MSRSREGLGVLGFGAAACAACCVGPVLGFLGAIGVGTVLGVAVFGLSGLMIAGLAIPLIVRRRRQRADSCIIESVPITLGRRE